MLTPRQGSPYSVSPTRREFVIPENRLTSPPPSQNDSTAQIQQRPDENQSLGVRMSHDKIHVSELPTQKQNQ